MKRREFITGLAGAAAEPLAAWAQQPPRRIAVLLASDNSNPEDEARLNALLRGLQQLGRSDGHDVALDIRWAGGNSKQTEKIVAEVVAFAPEIIVSSGSVATAAFQRATATIPVVFALVNEPAAQGFVASLARPGGNITGFTNTDFSVLGKWVELLKTMAPVLDRIGLFFNAPNYPWRCARNRVPCNRCQHEGSGTKSPYTCCLCRFISPSAVTRRSPLAKTRSPHHDRRRSLTNIAIKACSTGGKP